MFDGSSFENDEKIFREFFQAYQKNKAELGILKLPNINAIKMLEISGVEKCFSFRPMRRRIYAQINRNGAHEEHCWL